MSRLYITTKSDIRNGTGKRSHESAFAQINWGSVGNSKRAASLRVVWLKGADTPSVFVSVGENENPVEFKFHSKFIKGDKK